MGLANASDGLHTDHRDLWCYVVSRQGAAELARRQDSGKAGLDRFSERQLRNPDETFVDEKQSSSVMLLAAPCHYDASARGANPGSFPTGTSCRFVCMATGAGFVATPWRALARRRCGEDGACARPTLDVLLTGYLWSALRSTAYPTSKRQHPCMARSGIQTSLHVRTSQRRPRLATNFGMKWSRQPCSGALQHGTPDLHARVVDMQSQTELSICVLMDGSIRAEPCLRGHAVRCVRCAR